MLAFVVPNFVPATANVWIDLKTRSIRTGEISAGVIPEDLKVMRKDFFRHPGHSKS